jgi:hypothetical protein
MYKTLHLDSIDSKTDTNGITTQTLTTPFKLVNEIELKAAIFSIPSNIRASNGTNQFTFEIGVPTDNNNNNFINYPITATIPEGYYPTINDLLNALNNDTTYFPNYNLSITYSLDRTTGLFQFTINQILHYYKVAFIESITTKVIFGFKNFDPVTIPSNSYITLLGSNLPVPLYDTYFGLYLLDIPVEPTASSNGKCFTFKIPVLQNINTINNLTNNLKVGHIVSSYFDNQGYKCVVMFNDKQYYLEKIRYQMIDRFGKPVVLQETQLTFKVGVQ